MVNILFKSFFKHNSYNYCYRGYGLAPKYVHSVGYIFSKHRNIKFMDIFAFQVGEDFTNIDLRTK